MCRTNHGDCSARAGNMAVRCAADLGIRPVHACRARRGQRPSSPHPSLIPAWPIRCRGSRARGNLRDIPQDLSRPVAGRGRRTQIVTRRWSPHRRHPQRPFVRNRAAFTVPPPAPVPKTHCASSRPSKPHKQTRAGRPAPSTTETRSMMLLRPGYGGPAILRAGGQSGHP